MRPLTRIIRHTRELMPLYVAIVICSAIVTGLTLLTPYLVKRATDVIVAALRGEAPHALAALGWIAFALLVTELAHALISNVNGFFGDLMAARMKALLSTRYFEKLLGLPQRYFDGQVTGTIISRLQRSITGVTDFLNSFSNNFLPMLMTVASVLIISARYEPLLSVLLILVFPAYMWLTALTSKKWQRLEGEKNAEIDAAGGRFAEVVGAMRVVKSFVAERRELTQFDGHYAKTIGTTREQSRYWHGMDAVRRTVLAITFFGIYLLIFRSAAQGHMSVGDMVMLVQLVAMVKNPVTMMSYLVDTSQRAVAGSRDYFAVMDEPSDPEEVAEPGPAAVLTAAERACAPDVVLKDVTFGYDGTNPVLEDVSFDIKPGQKLALVSESGGGKTTIVSLLLGLYRPNSGDICVAGHDLANVPLKQLRELVGVVFQDASLFSGTIRENIAYGRPDATDEQIVDAAKRANAHHFITRLPHGYDTTIGERGLKLSGGQKQRIAIARALLKDAPILVLDEATSALDGKAERQVQAGLEELMANRTTLIIAHRLSTIAGVDTIVTLADGRVDEIGSPAELATTGGIYAELLELSASASKLDRKRLREFDIVR